MSRPARAGVLLLAAGLLVGVARAQDEDPWYRQPKDAAGLLRWEALPERTDWEAVAWAAFVHLSARALGEARSDVQRMLEQDPANPDAQRYGIRIGVLEGGNAALQQAARSARGWLASHPEMPDAHRQEVLRDRNWAERELLRRSEVAGRESRARLAPAPGLLLVALLALALGRQGRRAAR